MLASSVNHFSAQGANLQKLPQFHQSNLATKTLRANTLGRRRNFSIYAGNQAQISIDIESEKGNSFKLQELLDHDRYPFEFGSMPSKSSTLRVAYQGVKGAYSQAAAEKAYSNCESVPWEQFDDAFEAVEKGLVDRAVLPFENSLGGSIHRNYDLLFRHRLHIVGEVKLAIRHCLLANPGVKIEELKKVFSHPQALAQCENTLTKLGLVRESRDNTAASAKFVASNNLKDAGAVASITTARLYGLNILAQDIQDESDNVTRFLMLSKKPVDSTNDKKPLKTSIVFSLKDGPGMLFKPLSIFASENINVTKIETRPLQKQALQSPEFSANGCSKQFPYLFYIDFEASMADQKAQNALGHLKEFVTYLRVFGSYPIDISVP